LDERPLQLASFGVESGQSVEDAAFECQSGDIGLLIAGPLPGKKVARCQEEQSEVAGSQGIVHVY
jgi:hypothetical protein